MSVASELPSALRVSHDDNVAVALRPLEAGETVAVDGLRTPVRNAVRAGHKFALKDFQPGDRVIRYGAPIGIVTQSITAGEHVHSHNLRTALVGEVAYRFSGSSPSRSSVVRPRTFRGYRRKGGKVGTRNEVWILPTVGCVGRLSEKLASAGAELARGRVDGVHAFNHPFGCSQLGADLQGTTAILASLAQNPNAGGVLLVGLGCESNQLDALCDTIPSEAAVRVRTLRAQDEEDEFAAGMALIESLIIAMAADEREETTLSGLCLGVKCGGSDAMSGLTANPLIGHISDAVTGAGGSAILTEIPEMFGAETLLMERAQTEHVFEQLGIVINRFKRYFLENGEPVSENPSPGNIAGGITTLEEKSLGAVQKGGHAMVRDVIDYGSRTKVDGLTILEAPGNDAVSSTALAAAGANIVLFSTGRGTPLGCPVPTIKIASNSPLAASKSNWIDFDGGCVLECGMESAAAALLEKILETASGCPTRNELNEERSIGIWKRGVTL
ncbi:MAG TPA: altronate dehydratase family protein [Gemmatimonadaceae bacterium]|nr:altronate dehydratase family protein [Gemmatimonadaceae bacterium]